MNVITALGVLVLVAASFYGWPGWALVVGGVLILLGWLTSPLRCSSCGRRTGLTRAGDGYYCHRCGGREW